jgi:hypothetical protein
VKKSKKKIFDFPEVKPILSHISYEESKKKRLPSEIHHKTLCQRNHFTQIVYENGYCETAENFPIDFFFYSQRV